jgi:hypothetical protein
MKLRQFEIRWAETIGRSLLPRGLLGGVVDDTNLGEQFRLECLQPPWYSSLLVRVSLWLTWFAPLWMLGRLRTFGGLDAAAREALLERLLSSKRYYVRLAAMFLKLTACTLLLSDERALAHIGAYGMRPRALRSAS